MSEMVKNVHATIYRRPNLTPTWLPVICVKKALSNHKTQGAGEGQYQGVVDQTVRKPQ